MPNRSSETKRPKMGGAVALAKHLRSATLNWWMQRLLMVEGHQPASAWLLRIATQILLLLNPSEPLMSVPGLRPVSLEGGRRLGMPAFHMCNEFIVICTSP